VAVAVRRRLASLLRRGGEEERETLRQVLGLLERELGREVVRNAMLLVELTADESGSPALAVYRWPGEVVQPRPLLRAVRVGQPLADAVWEVMRRHGAGLEWPALVLKGGAVHITECWRAPDGLRCDPHVRRVGAV
jgi:hypothetical protein